MASTTLMPDDVSVIPLDRIGPGGLDAVFAAQRREWLERLDWDTSEVATLVGGAIRSGALQGVALLVRGAPAGLSFYSTEAARSLIGEVYILPEFRSPATGSILAGAVLDRVEAARPAKRIESQLICFDPRGIDEVFRERGFARFERDFLVADPAGPARTLEEGHPRVRIRPWTEADYGPVVELIYQSYRGTIDAKINCQYRTRDGCADLLDALTGTAWCGRFDPRSTCVAVERGSERCCGVAICSAVSATAAHLSQVSVLPDRQGEGVGRTLVLAARAAVTGAGFARVSLAVTRANATAARLYERCGFAPRLAFPVFVREARAAGRRAK